MTFWCIIVTICFLKYKASYIPYCKKIKARQRHFNFIVSRHSENYKNVCMHIIVRNPTINSSVCLFWFLCAEVCFEMCECRWQWSVEAQHPARHVLVVVFQSGQLTLQWMNGWTNEWMDEWSNKWKNVWMNEWMNGWTDEWMNGWIYKWTNERMSEWINDGISTTSFLFVG